MSPADIEQLPLLPRDEEGPVFAEPWQAQAFAMAIRLHESGAFTWPEWVEVFSAEIADVKARGEADLGDTYYHHWLAALEKIVSGKGLLSRDQLSERKDAWERAAAASPHGEPILLEAEIRAASSDG